MNKKELNNANRFLFHPTSDAQQRKLPTTKDQPSSHILPLEMNGLRISSHSRLLKRLRERGMRMRSPSHILRRRPILQRQRPLRNHLARIRPHNMNPQDPVRLRVRDELHQTLGIEIRLRAGVGGERECADFVLDAFGFEVCFGLADPGDFRVGVHDGGDGVVVYMAVVFGQVFDGCDGFFFGFVCEHGPEGAVADHADVGDFGTVFRVDDQAAAVVGFDADGVEVQAGGVGSSADGYEDDVCVELCRVLLVVCGLGKGRGEAELTVCVFPSLDALNVKLDALAGGVAVRDFSVEHEFHALLAQRLLDVL